MATRAEMDEYLDTQLSNMFGLLAAMRSLVDQGYHNPANPDTVKELYYYHGVYQRIKKDLSDFLKQANLPFRQNSSLFVFKADLYSYSSKLASIIDAMPEVSINAATLRTQYQSLLNLVHIPFIGSNTGYPPYPTDVFLSRYYERARSVIYEELETQEDRTQFGYIVLAFEVDTWNTSFQSPVLTVEHLRKEVSKRGITLSNG